MNPDVVGQIFLISEEGHRLWGCPRCGYKYAEKISEGEVEIKRCRLCQDFFAVLSGNVDAPLKMYSLRRGSPARLRPDSRPEGDGEFIRFEGEFLTSKFWRRCFVCEERTNLFVTAEAICKAAAKRVQGMFGYASVGLNNWNDWQPATVSIGVCGVHRPKAELLKNSCKTDPKNTKWMVLTPDIIKQAIEG